MRWTLVLALIGGGLAGCGGPPGAVPASVGAGGGPGRLLAEVRRELADVRTTHYQHTTRVDEARGVYRYDCSGLLDYALGRARPADVRALPTSTSVRPLAADVEHYLNRALTGGPVPGWRAVDRIDALRPGDVIAWLATEDSTTGDTGHVMVVLDAPTADPDPARAGEWLVPVADATLHPHAHDSRGAGVTGLGAGTVGLIAGPDGRPTAFTWRGGLSPHPKPTDIALGRPD